MSSPSQNLPAQILDQPFNNNMSNRETVNLSQKPSTSEHSDTVDYERNMNRAVGIHPVEYIRGIKERTVFNPPTNTSSYYIAPIDDKSEQNVVLNIPPELPISQGASN